MLRPFATTCLIVAALTVLAASAHALTARDLSGRVRIDGFTGDFTADERIFGYNETFEEPEEGLADSKWGENNDLNQIRITWDQKFLYLAGEGRIWDNNMILYIDSTPGRGLGAMDSLNSWRRNFAFDTSSASRGEGFAPDLFGATWDGNTSPRLIMHERAQLVRDYTVGLGHFTASATFDKGNLGRSMEFAIPWSSVFLGPVGLGTRDTVLVVGGVPDTFPRFPPGTVLKITGVITAGPDGTGGPDSAPDNTRGHTDGSGDRVIIDNWAIVEIDRNDDTGLGAGGPDGIADWNVDPSSRVSFRFRPPIPASIARTLRFSLGSVDLDRQVIRPDLGDRVRFRMSIDPPPDPGNDFHQITTVEMRADVFDVRGRFVTNLFPFTARRVLDTANPVLDQWDGRDSEGRPVAPGVYVLRVELKDISRVNRAVVVVR
jgi:hypothetical protein